MQLQIVFTPGCVACMAMRLMVRRVSPDYPDLEVEEIDARAQPDADDADGLRRAPAVVLDGTTVASTHLREAALRRALLRASRGLSAGAQPSSRRDAPRARRLAVWPRRDCTCRCGCVIRERLRPYRVRRRRTMSE